MTVKTNQAKRLRELCAEYSLPAAVEAGLFDQVRYLALWKDQILPATLTPKQQAEALTRVKNLALALETEIKGLPFDLKGQLDSEYFGHFGSAELAKRHEHCLELGYDATKLDLGHSVAPDIAAAAQRALEALSLDKERHSGRQPITHRQAEFIRCIAQCVMPAGIAPNTGAKFRSLCEAVFAAAGLTFPDKALRYFVKSIRPQLRAAGYCL